MVDESSGPRRGAREIGAKVFLEEWLAPAVHSDSQSAKSSQSDVAAFSAGPSPPEDCLAEDVFVDEVRGGVPEPERVKLARREEGNWCRGVGL